jgi:large subunit ribosomal protein L3
VSIGLLGTKLGMTQIFDEEGRTIPVTVIQAGPCQITQIKTQENDGYAAIQVGYKETREKSLTRPELGHLRKSDAPPLRYLREFRVEDASEYELGQELKVDNFSPGQLVDISGKRIGRGFAGYQKRHNFRRGSRTHGSKNYRLPGSVGPGTDPSRVYPGKRMAGRMGDARITIRKLTVVKVDPERNLLVVKGSVPGKSGNLLNIRPANLVGGNS